MFRNSINASDSDPYQCKLMELFIYLFIFSLFDNAFHGVTTLVQAGKDTKLVHK